MANNVNVKKLEADLWESADLLRAGSKLTSNQYCMPVLGLIFLRYAYSRFKLVEQEILKDRPMRGGRVLPVEQSDFAEKSALFLPKEAQYNYLVNLPANIPEQGLTGIEGKGLSISNRNANVYVSMDYNLLFTSCSVEIAPNRARPSPHPSAGLAQNPTDNTTDEGHTDSVP